MRRVMMPFILSLSALAIAGCAARPKPVVVSAPPPPAEAKDWMNVATPADREKLAMLPGLFAHARSLAARRFRTKLAAEGPLVDPTAGLTQPALPPGPYHCRLIRFGGRAGFATYDPDFCYVDAPAGTGDSEAGVEGAMSFTKQTGVTLPQGWLYPDGDNRAIFLGALRAGPSAKAPKYGANPADGIAGIVERVSPFRWRMILTRAGRGATLDMYELVPVTPEVPGAKPAVPAAD